MRLKIAWFLNKLKLFKSSISAVLLSLIPSILLSIDPIVIDDALRSLELSESGYYYYQDPTKQLDISKIKSLKSCFLFKKDNKSFNPKNEAIWTHFELQYEGIEEEINITLELAHAHIEEYKIYIYENDKLLKYDHQGDHFIFDQRAISHNFFIHPISLSPNARYSIFFQLDQYGQETPFHLNIYKEGLFSKINIMNKLMHGLVIGLCMITSLVTLILYLIFKKRYYLIEVFVSVFSILYILAEEGYGFMYIWSNFPIFNGISRPLFVACVILFGLWFTLEFLDVRSRTPKCFKISLGLGGTYILYLLLFHPFNLSGIRNLENVGSVVNIFMILTILNGFMILCISFLSWRQKKNTDGLVIFGVFLITIILSFLRLLGIQGIIPHTELIQHTGFITRALHIPVIGLYLVYHALGIINKNKNVQIDLLQAKQNSNNQLVQGVNNERRRIAMALHDSVGGLITGLKAHFEIINRNDQKESFSEHYESGINIINNLNNELRTISNNLYPSTLQKLGIVEEIKKLLNEIKQIHNIEVHMEIRENDSSEINIDIQLQLYYILHEILDNAVVHADPKNIWVQFNQYEDEINIVVEDDGVGFNYPQGINKGRNGLSNLHHRVTVLDGIIDFYSKPNEGTSVSINIPNNS